MCIFKFEGMNQSIMSQFFELIIDNLLIPFYHFI